MPKVLVTGGCGFLGSHICELFKNRGWEVIAYDNLTKHEFARNLYMKPEARKHNKKFLIGWINKNRELFYNSA